MKKIVIFGIDNFSKKNINQIWCLNKNNFKASIFTNDSLNNSTKNCDEQTELNILEKPFLKRIFQVFNFLKKNKKDIVHAEIYPGGRFAPMYLVLCKIFNIKTIAVERGDLLYWSKYSIFYKVLLRIVYRYSDIVWYRELYMKNILLSLGSKNVKFIHNCVSIKEESSKKLKYDFIWVNRLIKERKSKWFVDVTNEISVGKNIVLGVMNSSKEEQYALNNQSEFLITLKYQDPTEYYLKSKFFVLPADIVFANNALLEAMSYGLVPLVSNVDGAKLIINNGVDGFIFDHTKEGLKKAMERALAMSDDEYEIMSKNAIKKVKDKFSCDVWCQKYIKMIKELNNV